MRGTGILINDDYELIVSDNRKGGMLTGLPIGKTTPQNSAVILAHQPGGLKEDITLGVGIENILMDNDLAVWRRRIRLALEQDGQQVQTVNIGESNIEINAKY